MNKLKDFFMSFTLLEDWVHEVERARAVAEKNRAQKTEREADTKEAIVLDLASYRVKKASA